MAEGPPEVFGWPSWPLVDGSGVSEVASAEQGRPSVFMHRLFLKKEMNNEVGT